MAPSRSHSHRGFNDRGSGDRLTAVENLAISLIYRVMDESLCNRTAHEYQDIGSRLPALKVLHHRVNEALREFLASNGDHHPEFCRFEGGHERIVFERYPTAISRETLRKALILHGFREPRSGRQL